MDTLQLQRMADIDQTGYEGFGMRLGRYRAFAWSNARINQVLDSDFIGESKGSIRTSVRRCPVEALKDGVVAAAFDSESEGFHILDTDLSDVRLGLQDFQNFRNEFVQRHRASIGRAPAHEFRPDVRRNQLNNRRRGPFELMAEGLRVRVDGSLRRAIN